MIKEMRESGLSNWEIAGEFVAAVGIFVLPILIMLVSQVW